MRMTKFVSAVAAVSLLASSTVASAATSGSSLSAAAGKQVRKSSAVGRHSKLDGGIDGTVLIIFLLLAGGIFILAAGHGDHQPNSP